MCRCGRTSNITPAELGYTSPTNPHDEISADVSISDGQYDSEILIFLIMTSVTLPLEKEQSPKKYGTKKYETIKYKQTYLKSVQVGE